MGIATSRTSKPRSIAIIGAGFSGALTALHLLRNVRPDDRIYLIERNAQFGRGLAYATGNPNHLLNVRAGNMSAYPDAPDHFVRWLRNLPKETRALLGEYPGPTTFVPRGLYGSYIQQQLGDEIWRRGNGKNLFLVTDEAVAIHRDPQAGKPLSVELAVGRRLPVDRIVVASGNLLPRKGKGAYFGNPWDEATTKGLDPEAEILVIGTGLTMVDTVVSLLDQRHRGRITAVSRRGLLPRLHLAGGIDDLPRPWHFSQPLSSVSILRLLRQVRAACRDATAAGEDWRIVIDGLRPHTQRLWQEMPIVERRRFLRHLRPYWDVHRHRSAPRVMARVLDAIQRRQLSIVAGRIEAMTDLERQPAITLRKRDGGDVITLSPARIIDCTGLAPDLTRIEQPVIRQLLADGIARPDPLNLGIEVTAEGALIDRDGRRASDIFAIGPITRGTFWEIIAVPDIRIACERLAHRLLAGSACAKEKIAASA
ncbi:MAG TPA: FAD-dependent oxidoreductase [Alphaproteobacteria bacterium]|nr:FAD-dependent oxidoreductase [Alphaproteobacteria bacterium]